MFSIQAYRFVVAILVVLSLLLCCSCSSDSRNTNDAESGSQAYAYVEVFAAFVDQIDERRIKYLGIDTTGIVYENHSEIEDIFKKYAKKHNVSVRWNVSKSECDYKFFRRGWLIIFEDIELSETKLETEATWMGAVALASWNATFTVEIEAGKWVITDEKTNWVS